MLRFVFGVLARSARRRALEEQCYRQEAMERAHALSGDRSAAGPFAGMGPLAQSPFGSLLEQMVAGPAGAGGPDNFQRSLAYDEQRGQWVDISDQAPERFAEPAPSDAAPAPGPGATTARRNAPARPLTNLLGGLGKVANPGGNSGGEGLEVQSPDQLSRFADVGGMESLKQEIRDTVGLMLEHPDDAERYGIDWNGILLHGPPGVGKTFMAKAIAGEYGMNLIHVSTGDLVGSQQGQSAKNIDKAFATAARNLPCLIFFDEFDSVAQRRGENPDQESRRTVNQLLTSLEAHREERGLLVMAATNSIDHLDPAVIRPGRFDRHIRIDLPDGPARRAIFGVELADRPAAADIDLDELVSRSEGMTPASISKVVDMAALEVFREAAGSGRKLELTTENLLDALGTWADRTAPPSSTGPGTP